jgi:ABC-2 type transport system permease protein
MRAVMFEGAFPIELLGGAIALNVVYLGVGAAVFLYTFRVARMRGLLLQMGE